jgi:hypothetical protein
VFASRSLSFLVLLIQTFEEVSTVAYALMYGIFEFETEPKD